MRGSRRKAGIILLGTLAIAVAGSAAAYYVGNSPFNARRHHYGSYKVPG